MVRKTVDAPDSEPNQYQKPSEGEHLFMVSDVFVDPDDDNIVTAKCEVAEGDEIGKSILNRMNLDQEFKGFFAVRMFLKAIGLPYKGKGILIDSDDWVGRSFYANVIHVQHTNGKTYANIDDYNYDKMVDNPPPASPLPPAKEGEEVAWDDAV